MTKIIARILFDLILAILVLEGWWLAAAIVAVCALWVNEYYAEALIAGLVYDALYGFSPEQGIRGYVGLMLALVLTIVVSLSKRLVRR